MDEKSVIEWIFGKTWKLSVSLVRYVVINVYGWFFHVFVPSFCLKSRWTRRAMVPRTFDFETHDDEQCIDRFVNMLYCILYPIAKNARSMMMP